MDILIKDYKLIKIINEMLKKLYQLEKQTLIL